MKPDRVGEVHQVLNGEGASKQEEVQRMKRTDALGEDNLQQCMTERSVFNDGISFI